MDYAVRWWYRVPVLVALVMREYRPLLLVITTYTLFLAAIILAAHPVAEVQLFVIALFAYLFVLGAPSASANNWRAVLLSADRLVRAKVLEQAVESHADVLEIYLAVRLGEFRNQLLVARSTRLQVDLDEPHRERATDLVLHTIKLSLAWMRLDASGAALKTELRRYRDRVYSEFEGAKTAPGAVTDFSARFYDEADPRIRTESQIWLMHGSIWDAVERHSTLVRLVEVLVLVTVVGIGLAIFRTLPLVGL